MSLPAALAAAQAEFPPIERTKDVRVKGVNRKTGQPFEYTFSYAPLDAILRAVGPTLAKHGLALSQLLATTADGKPALRTLLLHKDGDMLEDSAPLPVNGGESAQELGSAISYLRRYALVSILGIATEEDDDGNAASGNTISRPATAGHGGGGKGSGGFESPAAAPSEDNPAAQAQAAQEAAKAARTPADGGLPSEVVCHFGKNAGTKLGDLTTAQLRWYAETWEPKDRPEDRRLKMAAESLHRGANLPDFDIPFAPIP